MNFIARWLAPAVAVAAAAWIVPGIDIVGGDNAWIIIAVFALVLSLVNIGLKPILQTLSLPLTFLTFGIFYLIVNTLLLYIASWLTDGLFGMGLHIATFLRQRLRGVHRHQHRVVFGELPHRGQVAAKRLSDSDNLESPSPSAICASSRNANRFAGMRSK